jgi:dTDP-4-amino-4,6-dideoxygalactose transaminase
MLAFPSRTKHLAIQGGIPIRQSKNFKWPIFDALEVDSLRKFINEREWWSQLTGSTNKVFQHKSPAIELQNTFSSIHGCKYGISCSSGTAALILALKALGIGAGDSVIVPDYTWMATAQAVVLAGAEPIFCDIEPMTFNLDPNKIKPKANTKAIIPVHMLGLPAETNYDIPVIEDACLAHGAFYQGKPVGSLGVVAAFSFNAYKLIASGEGGIVTTNDKKLAIKIEELANNGQSHADPWWQASQIGYNFRMNQFAAVLCNAQISRLNKFKKIRNQQSDIIRNALQDIPGIQIQPKYHDRESAYYGLPLTYDRKMYQVNPEKLAEIIRAEGIEIDTNYGKPLSQQPAFEKWRVNNPVAQQATTNTLCFPHSVLLSDWDVKSIIECFEKIYSLRESL